MIKIGDKVIPIDSKCVLHCGTGTYPHAICVSVEPFILISEEGDMRWDKQKIQDYTSLGLVSSDIWKVCMERFNRDIANKTQIKKTYESIIDLIYIMTDKEREGLFNEMATKFCYSCGSKDPNCQCWNDD
jgi:hypothetical protein